MTGLYRIVDRGDDWATRWGHTGWRYSLHTPDGRPVILDIAWRRGRAVPVTGTTSRHEIEDYLAAIPGGPDAPPSTQATATTQLTIDDLLEIP